MVMPSGTGCFESSEILHAHHGQMMNYYLLGGSVSK
jgi:hypothetical protein